MIKVIFYKNSNDNIVEFKISGHAEFDNIGKDIVCSAVSFLVINTINSIEKFILPDLNYAEIFEDKKNGIIEFRIYEEKIKEEKNLKIQLLLKSMELGLNMISEKYKDNLFIRYKEV